MTTFTAAEVDAFIAEEGKYHDGLTRQKAIQYLENRRAAAARISAPEKRATKYEDRYGNQRWSDDNSVVERNTQGR